MKESIIQVLFLDGSKKTFEMEGDSLESITAEAEKLSKLIKKGISELEIRFVDDLGKGASKTLTVSYVPKEMLTK